MARGSLPLACILLAMAALTTVQSAQRNDVTCRGKYKAYRLANKEPGLYFICLGTLTSGRPTPQRVTGPRSCMDIKRKGNHNTGYHNLVDNSGRRYRAYCEMKRQYGGWTLFATKVSPAFRFLTKTLNRNISPIKDSAGCIPNKNWKEVMFSFKGRNERLIFTRSKAGSSEAAKAFVHALQCDLPFMNKIGPIGGFVRYTPYNLHRRTPSWGYYTIRDFNVNPSSGQLSESHAGTGKWLDLWIHRGGKGYDKVDNPTAQGTKCVAGTCYANTPVDMWYR